MWWNTVKAVSYHDFMAGKVSTSFIAPSPSFEYGLDLGLMFFGGIAVVTIGLAIAEKLGYNIDSSKVVATLSVLFWLGLFLLLVLKNPLLGFIR
ncbi:hypothetical protein [Sutcliffiella horikoshii]|uniref:hypothetical protein n=1 Tax=Sutcliffiella horikoshii TaxID=79883 RepID=UPI003CE8CBD2